MLDLKIASQVEAVFLKPLSISAGNQGQFSWGICGWTLSWCPGSGAAASLGQFLMLLTLSPASRTPGSMVLWRSLQDVQRRTSFFNPVIQSGDAVSTWVSALGSSMLQISRVLYISSTESDRYAHPNPSFKSDPEIKPILPLTGTQIPNINIWFWTSYQQTHNFNYTYCLIFLLCFGQMEMIIFFLNSAISFFFTHFMFYFSLLQVAGEREWCQSLNLLQHSN